MLALLIVVICLVALLAVLVVGLLRSHADILRALHALGVGVGDPARQDARAGNRERATAAASGKGVARYGPTLPDERSTSAPDLSGVTPDGAVTAVAVNGPERLTLLAFLSSGCQSCSAFWKQLASPELLGLPEGVRVVAVTKGPDRESPAEVAALAGNRLTTLMSSDAWSDYEVPGAPFFALVDGAEGRRIGEGVGGQPAQLADLVRRALADRRALARQQVTMDGPAREVDNDRQLVEAGVLPGDESLYPTSLADVLGRANHRNKESGRT